MPEHKGREQNDDCGRNGEKGFEEVFQANGKRSYTVRCKNPLNDRHVPLHVQGEKRKRGKRILVNSEQYSIKH